jgi:hypothetical protein
MNVLKNMEIIFVVAAVLATATSFATAGVPEVVVRNAAVSSHTDVKMATVTVTAKRLSAAEKAALI